MQQTNIQLYQLTQAIIQNGNLNSAADRFSEIITTWTTLSKKSTEFKEFSEDHNPPPQCARVATSISTFTSGENGNIETSQYAQLVPRATVDRTLPTSKSLLSRNNSELSGMSGVHSSGDLPQSVQQTASPKYAKMENYGDISVLKSHTKAIAFHSPWLGTVIISRRKIAHKSLNDESQHYESCRESVETTIRIQPAPWFLCTGYEIKINELITIYGSSTLNMSLEPIRSYPLTREWSFRHMELPDLQRLLKDRVFSIKDRDTVSGHNLLEITMNAIGSDWFSSEMDGDNFKRSKLVRTSRWLVSEGLVYDYHTDGGFLKSFMHLSRSDSLPTADADAEAYEYEQLLLESTNNAPCLERARMLLLFAVQNPTHSMQLRTTVDDLVSEAVTDYDAEALAKEAETFWAEGDMLNYGIEVVLVSCMLQLQRIPRRSIEAQAVHDFRIKALQGPRRILYRILLDMPASDIHQGQDNWQDNILVVGNLLKLCKSFGILDDDFGAFLSDVACQNHILDMWHAILRHAGYDPETYVDKYNGSALWEGFNKGHFTTTGPGCGENETEESEQICRGRMIMMVKRLASCFKVLYLLAMILSVYITCRLCNLSLTKLGLTGHEYEAYLR